MRLTSDNSDFPWRMQTVCYICIVNNIPKQIGTDITRKDAYQEVLEGNAAIVAVWPGKWRSDAFLVDNIETYAEAFDLVP